MNDTFKDESPKKGLAMIIALNALLLFTMMGIGIDFDEFTQHEQINIPTGYFYFIFFIDLIMLFSIVYIYFYRKIAVYLFPVAVLLHFIAHNYYLSTFLYTDVTNLFLFISFGLFAIIPKWQFFK